MKMKYGITLIVACSLSLGLMAQTNTFPENGNVGIGTSNPSEKLEIMTNSTTHALFRGYSGGIQGIQVEKKSGDKIRLVTGYPQFGGGLESTSKLSFAVNGNDISSPSMVINADGNVGIGTKNPQEKLHVDGLIKIERANGDDNNSPGLACNGSGDFLYDDEYINGDGFGFHGYKGSSAPTEGINAYVSGYYGIDFFTKGESRMRVDYNGSVSISNILNIGKASGTKNSSPGIAYTFSSQNLYDGEYINRSGFGFHDYRDTDTKYTNPVNTYVSGDHGIDFFTESVKNRMRISRDGIVSIGTTERQPGYKLVVNGKVLAKEIKVQTNGWSDYVFTADYDLPTLKEVEQHIAEKGHLINIPSAKEVEEHGIYLGEMNKLLLEKIEELTLYTLQQQKELENQKKKNGDLEHRLQVLEARINP